MALLESGEMYLETILVLTRKLGTGNVRSIDIAVQSGYSKPSVSRAVGILKDGGFIEVSDSGYITLTETGMDVASTIYERHVLLTDFFVKIGVDKEIAAADACKVEHCISKETFSKLKEHIKALS
ncbi:MAG: metal-dependent transcriptional regulator [Ruminococcus sp.]|nr:metal-dependent transcriptional regulator [Ruminococcus sp.]